ncbi:amidase [Gordonia sp. ABSL11-1]|uniref:amidase n=1 Tax=Gordonia sp. ABSL11-1 TaxID=3053924 RepID=UPI002573B570|nr:amidase [Gordonia sp. ABSL11-1]MDL9946713.1 amidase [Gordonia sp. ABSL11-1]
MKYVHAFGDDVLGDLDGVGIAAAIRAGEFSATEAVQAAIARIDAVNPQVNAVAVDDRERARSRAADADFGAGSFAGVPSIIKNNTLFEGLPVGNGSAAMPDLPAKGNEPFTEQFLSTGVNIVGASTLPAFGLTATTEFVDRDPTRNPWDTDYSSGASSGGSAALVAAGALAVAHGNDGGGSIRIPAAACGLVGLKPTRGRVAPSPTGQVLPVDIISNGVLSRTVRDTAHFISDAETFRAPEGLPRVGLVEGPGKRRLRIGLVDTTVTGQPIDAETSAALASVADLLTELGHDVERIPIPLDEAFVRQFVDYWSMLACSMHRLGWVLVGKDFDRDALDPFTIGLSRRYLRTFWRTPSTIIGLKRSTARFRTVFDGHDLVLTPTLAHTTPKIGYLDPGGDFDEIFERLVHYVAFTPANNATGTPAISLPLARTFDGLPLGLHFSADLGRERTLLELAFELEAARPFARIQDQVVRER